MNGMNPPTRDRADGRPREILFRVGEFVGGIARKAQTGELRTIADSLRDQIVGGCRRSGWQAAHPPADNSPADRTRSRGPVRPERLLHAVLRPDQQQLRFRHVHIGEADVELRLQTVLRQLGHLIAQQLARTDGFLGDLHHGLRVQNVEIGAIHLEQHVVASGLSSLRRRLRLQARAGHQIRSAAGIGDQLADDRRPVRSGRRGGKRTGPRRRSATDRCPASR